MAIFGWSLTRRKDIKPTEGAFWSSYYGTENFTGKSITAHSVMQISAATACVRLIAETIGQLPLFVYEKQGPGQKRLASDMPLYRVLHDQPNADMTALEYWERVACHLSLWGRHHSRKIYSSTGQLIGLDPYDPWQVGPNLYDENGTIYWNVTELDGTQSQVDEEDVFYIRGFSSSRYEDLSIIRIGANTFGLSMAADESSAQTFSAGMKPSGFIQTPNGTLKPEQREQIRKSLQALKESPNGTMVLEAGMTYTQLSLNPEDAQLLQTRGFNIEEVCRWFRVPPYMIGHSAAGQTKWGTGMEQELIGFKTFTLAPYLKRIEQAIKRQLMSPAEKQRYYAEFSVEGLLRADSAGRAQLYQVYADHGIKTRNEIRELENDPPLPGGDSLTVQAQFVPLDKIGVAGNAPEDQGL